MKKLFFKKFIAAIFIFSISTSGPSLTLKLKADRNFRKTNSFFTINKVLKAGTLITIDDKYIDQHFHGKKRDELSILKWLENSKVFPTKIYKVSAKGRKKKDYFVPIKLKTSGEDGWVSLKSLARRKGIELITLRDTPLMTEVTLGFHPNTKLHSSIVKKEKLDNCDCLIFRNPTKDENLLFEKLNELSLYTNQIIHAEYKNLIYEANKDYKNRLKEKDIIRNFNRTCFPYTFETFYKVLYSYAKAYFVPVDLLLGIMTQESSGICGAARDESNKTKSYGLFQINSNTAKAKSCGKSKKHLTNAQCIENPFTNLEEAIQTLLSKYEIVNNKQTPMSKRIHFTSLKKKEKDRWRKALLAYNGGQAYVIHAHNDIRKFNKLYNLKLNPENWAIRRAFILRKVIEEKGGTMLPQKLKKKEGRKISSTLSNLAWVESVVSSSREESYRTQTNKWIEYIKSR